MAICLVFCWKRALAAVKGYEEGLARIETGRHVTLQAAMSAKYE